MENIIDTIVFDLETLGTTPGSVILSVGIVPFCSTAKQDYDELVAGSIELYFDIEKQIEAGLEVNDKTVKWWSEQSFEARQVFADADTISLRDFYNHLSGLGDIGNAFMLQRLKWYARGPAFDHALFEAALAKFNVTPPWKFWMARDTRTFCDVTGITKELRDQHMPQNMVAHRAAHDAAYDAWLIQHHDEITGVH